VASFAIVECCAWRNPFLAKLLNKRQQPRLLPLSLGPSCEVGWFRRRHHANVPFILTLQS
jgi:hypothetical protein